MITSELLAFVFSLTQNYSGFFFFLGSISKNLTQRVGSKKTRSNTNGFLQGTCTGGVYCCYVECEEE